MKVSVQLANFAKVSDGMLDSLGAGWTFIGPGPVSFFAAGIVSVDWHELNRPHDLRIELLDADGASVLHPANGNPILAGLNWEMGRPPGTKEGSSLNFPFAVPFGGFELAPGRQYVVVVSIDGESRDEWRLPFTVRDLPPQPPVV
jgi:hypothetical protein